MKKCKCGHDSQPYHNYPNIVGCGFVYDSGKPNVRFCSCKRFEKDSTEQGRGNR